MLLFGVDMGRAVPHRALVSAQLAPIAKERAVGRQAVKAAVGEHHLLEILAGRHHVGHLAVGQTVRVPHAVAAARVALERRQVFVVDVVEHRGPLAFPLAVAVILQPHQVVEPLVGLFDADDGVGLDLAHGLAHAGQLLGEGLGHPAAAASGVPVPVRVTGRPVCTYHLVDLDHLAAAPGQRRADILVPPAARPGVAAAQAGGVAAPQPAGRAQIHLAVTVVHGMFARERVKARAVVPLEAAVVAFDVGQRPMIPRRPGEGVAAERARPGHQAGELLVRGIDGEIVRGDPTAELLPAPVRRDQRGLGEVLLPKPGEPAFDAVGVRQPVASETHHGRRVLQPGRQIVALREGLGAPMPRPGPGAVTVGRVPPVRRRAGRPREGRDRDIVRLAVSAGREARAGPGELHARVGTRHDQALGVPLVVIGRGVKAGPGVIVAAELGRHAAGLADGKDLPFFQRPRLAGHAALGCAHHHRVVIGRRAQRRGQRDLGVADVLQHPAVAHDHLDAPAQVQSVRVRADRADHALHAV